MVLTSRRLRRKDRLHPLCHPLNWFYSCQTILPRTKKPSDLSPTWLSHHGLGSRRAITLLGRERVFYQTQRCSNSPRIFFIQSFRAKLQFADRVFKSKRWPQKHVKKWNELYAQMQKQAELRNKLAHYIPRGYPAAKPGRRRALLPHFIAPTKYRQR